MDVSLESDSKMGSNFSFEAVKMYYRMGAPLENDGLYFGISRKDIQRMSLHVKNG